MNWTTTHVPAHRPFRVPQIASLLSLLSLLCLCVHSAAKESPQASHHGHAAVSDEVIEKQNLALERNTHGKGFGPQSPRDIDQSDGSNALIFSTAPAATEMNLCNIHFHRFAEHKGGDFTKYAGNGDGAGNGTGYEYTGTLSPQELSPVKEAICPSAHGSLHPGDTIAVHYVHSTARIRPGPTLGACLSEATHNPQLRVQAQVFVLVNDASALDFQHLNEVALTNGFYQAPYMPSDTGTPVTYAGSTTGPAYNEKASPLQVSWSVRPQTAKVDIASVGKWCKGNVFKEDHGHGVRNLITAPNLLSRIQR